MASPGLCDCGHSPLAPPSGAEGEEVERAMVPVSQHVVRIKQDGEGHSDIVSTKLACSGRSKHAGVGLCSRSHSRKWGTRDTGTDGRAWALSHFTAPPSSSSYG